MAGGIFISYRRQDAPGYAGRLYDSLAAHFGDEHVFMDIGAIEPGDNFARRIDDAVGSCDVLLAIIGPSWATVTDPAGRRRLDDPDDFVGLEVRTALLRPDVKLVPVLVDGARMPSRHELPKALATLAERQAHELSEGRWRYDVDRLIGALERWLGLTETRVERPQPEPERRPSSAWMPLVAVALGMLVAVGPGYGMYTVGLGVHHTTDIGKVLRFAAAWGLFWAVLAGVVSAVAAAAAGGGRAIVPRFVRGLLLGLVCGAAGGAVRGAISLHGQHQNRSIVAGFVVTGALFGLTRIAGNMTAVGVVGGALAGALGGWLVAGHHGLGQFLPQALPAALIILGIALLQAAGEASPSTAPAVAPVRRLQRP